MMTGKKSLPPDILKMRTRNLIIDAYNTGGLDRVNQIAGELIEQCETSYSDWQLRSLVKGELSEVVLECYLCKMQELLRVPSVILKNFCIKSQVTGHTAEMDVTFITPFKIYMFECKSYKGKKVITRECYLKADSSSKDILKQSESHIRILNEYMAPYRMNIGALKTAPYRFVLFELSSNDIVDKRTDKWKRTIPAVTLKSICNWIKTEFVGQKDIHWDVARALPILIALDKQSPQMFVEHLRYLKGVKR